MTTAMDKFLGTGAFDPGTNTSAPVPTPEPEPEAVPSKLLETAVKPKKAKRPKKANPVYSSEEGPKDDLDEGVDF